jgi:hypothetical protein
MGMTQTILAAAILVLGSTASAGERPTAEQLLKACQKSFESLTRVRIECQDVMKQADERVSKLTRELTIVRNAERWKIDYLGGGRMLAARISCGGARHLLEKTSFELLCPRVRRKTRSSALL